jgi:hypothetical protein
MIDFAWVPHVLGVFVFLLGVGLVVGILALIIQGVIWFSEKCPRIAIGIFAIVFVAVFVVVTGVVIPKLVLWGVSTI